MSGCKRFQPAGQVGLSLKWLRCLLEKSKVRQQIIWLDCCYSGELLNFDEANPGNIGNARDRCFIAASREFEPAYEDTAATHGLLTRVLLEGLDPGTQDSDITNHSLSHFISGHLGSSIQQPVFTNFGHPIILARQGKPAEKNFFVPGSVCPYKGLEFFDCNDEDPKYFFGRDDLTGRLLEKVRKSNFVAVLGPSGSGKTSVVRAGLLHQLKMGRSLSGTRDWPVRIFRPGEQPLKNLALGFVDTGLSHVERAKQLDMAESLIEKGAKGLECLVRATAEEDRVVLVADQFEEVFTMCRNADDRQVFFETLLGVLPLVREKLCLIIAMRADFFSKSAEREYAGLSDLIQENLATVTPMTREELEKAITMPAKKAGLTVRSSGCLSGVIV